MDSRVVGEKDSCASTLVTTCPTGATQPHQLPLQLHDTILCACHLRSHLHSCSSRGTTSYRHRAPLSDNR